MTSTSPTWVARLTPSGTAAIATLALRGPRAWEIAKLLFQPILTDQPFATDVVRLGHFGEAVADEVVLTVRRLEPEPWLELHCHGGREMVRALLEAIAQHGAELCTWDELERRTASDPLRALAASALSRATTQRTAGILLDQYNGAFTSAVSEILTALQRGDSANAAVHLEALVRHADLGRHLTTPWRVVVAGAPNVGKSSLVNALAGYQRSVVSSTPGTTRDVVTATIAVGGWPVEIADTAGLRSDFGTLEGEGIAQALDAVRDADLCLWVLDASEEPVWPTVDRTRIRFVVNKTDLPSAWDLSLSADAVRVSAHTGAGIGELCAFLATWLVPHAIDPGIALPFTPLLADRVEEALACLQSGNPTQTVSILERLFD